MSPHGPVIWLEAAATWAVLGGIGWLLWRFRRPPGPEVPCITDAEPAADPAEDLTEYVSEQPAFDSAYAIEADAYAGDEQ